VEPRKPWITERTLALSDEKRKLKVVRAQSVQKMEEYRRKCNEVRKAASKDRQTELVAIAKQQHRAALWAPQNT
jgi:hypothetical protein